ncbi:MAG TPA: carboxypeptidase-like regulatory domain-containing protein [Candidatus Acidoferrales bacterium]|nr:carboxypeptidase-like regulatory domain-containing protein [Candidatus Acidoferrales bacterium]
MANSSSGKSFRFAFAIFVSFLAALAFVVMPTAVRGQATNTGTVAGVVTDSTNAVVPGATVTITDPATHDTRTTATNADGRYIFVNVPPATYDITVTKAGFSQVKIAAQTVQVGLSLTENVTLQVGAATTTVEVQARGSDLQTMNSTVGNTISGNALSSLPSLGRDVSTFVTLQPGVSPDGSVAGTVVDQSSFQLDGGNNTNDMDGSMSVYTPSYSGDPTGGVANQGFGVAAGPTGVMPTPADSVQEFKVNSSNQTADFNSSSGAQVAVVTKRGTDNWHGTAYEYYLDNNFSANTWNNKAATPPIKQPSFHYNRFGGAVGGPIIPKSFLGGKTYFFANYQGFRWPNSITITKQTPTDSMRAGLLVFCGSAATTLTDPSCQVFNLNPNSVTFKGVTYPSSGLDPRGIGINSTISQLWAFMPLPNTSTVGDANNALLGNVAGFTGNMAIPQNDNFGVVRIDHDFGSKWHFMSSYRYYKLVRASTSQVDIGGFFPGDTLGTPASVSARPQEPWYYVASLTTDISSSTTNDFHWSFLRNWWAWGDNEDQPQFSGLGGALEPLGETGSPLAPYNLNTQDVRTRLWDGLDHMFRDDITTLHGNHLFQFGGTYEHNYDFHQRSDNGGGINYQPVYRMGGNGSNGAGIDMTGFVPTGTPPSNIPVTTWGEDYAATLGIVSISQTAFTRSGNNLVLNPPNTHAFDQSTIPFYNVYFSDTWHMKPSFTLNYGLGWTLEMPPVEKNGKQVALVDASDQPIDTQAYLASRERAALQGQVFNPEVGFALVGNTADGLKYPYKPFYGSFSPRVSAAWNPHFDSEGFMSKIFGQDSTVVRGGYGRIYGRLNGVDLVLVPLLGTGLIQAVQCIDPLMDAATCAGSNGANPGNAFRIGTDGLVAPLPAASPSLLQPDFPGINDIAAGAGEALDPNFRPNVVDSFDLTVQRQLSNKITLELGYIGRRITHEYQPININAVPYMMTLGGQRFDKAYAAIETSLGCATSTAACGAAIPSANLPGGGPNPAYAAYFNSLPAQPFFETALANTGYCSGSYAGVALTSCTANAALNEASNFTSQSVWNIWSDLDDSPDNSGKGFNFPRSMMNTPLPGPNGGSGQLTSGVGMNVSNGYGNYNAGFATVKMSDWKGLTMGSNFTWSKALGTGAEVQATSEYTPDDPFNLGTTYGLQPFDRKFVFNEYMVYQPPFYKGQQGFVGRVLGGWTIAPLFAAGSGLPIEVSTSNGDSQAFGEGDSNNFFSNENALLTGPNNFGSSAHFGVKGSNGIGVTGHGVNMFADPAAVFGEFRQPILGLDGNDGGFGVLRGLPYWNLDLSVKKNVAITERFSAEFDIVFVNVLNHDQYTDPQGSHLDTSNARNFGVITGEGTPRNMEFGLRLNF